MSVTYQEFFVTLALAFVSICLTFLFVFPVLFSVRKGIGKDKNKIKII
jgi:hypothetical protein